MASVTPPAARPQARTRKPEARTVSISAPCNGVHAVKLTVGKDSFGYYVERIPSAWGVAFRFTKFAAEQVEGEPSDYVVLIDEQGGRHQCECKGFCRFGMTAGRSRDAGHQGCKHVACVVELIRQGKIDATPIRTVGAPASKPAPAPESAKCCFECGKPCEDFYCDNGICGSL